MLETVLHDKHVALGAKMSEFAGFDMPINYAGVKEEVLAVREKCGIFDVSHMGEIRVQGKSADPFLDWVLSRPVSGKKGTALVSYAVLLYEDGGAVDDLLVYRFQAAEDYWLVVNAANKDKDFAYLNDIVNKFYETHPDAEKDIVITDESPLYGQIAVQGPESPEKMKALLEWKGNSAEEIEAILNMKSYRMVREEIDDKVSIVISRTGYTGEDGFEIYLPNDKTPAYWDKLMELGCEPCGLGARDALRLEAGMPLYGHEMSAELNPLDAGQAFVVKPIEGFIAEGNLKQKIKIVPVISEGRAIPREEYPVFVDGKEVGKVSSGIFSPTLGVGIAYVQVPVDFPDDVEEFMIKVHRREQPFKKTTLPFVKKD